MTLKISHKVFLAIVITTCVSLLAMQALQRISFKQGLLVLAQAKQIERVQPLISALKSQYRQDGWQSLTGKSHWPKRFKKLLEHKPPFEARSGDQFSQRNKHAELDGQRRFPRPPTPERLAPRHDIFKIIGLFDHHKKLILGQPTKVIPTYEEIIVDEQVIGYLALPKITKLLENIDKEFSNQQIKVAIYAILIALACAGILATIFTRLISSPVNLLLAKVDKLKEGDFDNQITDYSTDELGRLAENFNLLANTLKQDREKRRMWISDISHELRTPVAILQAELECIEDGHKPLDLPAILSLKDEVLRLNTLIEDLHQLAQADSGELTFHFQKFNFAHDIKDTVAGMNEQIKAKQLTVNVDFIDGGNIVGDPFRLRQLSTNLLENSMRYKEPGGVINITGKVTQDKLMLTFEDSAPGVPQQHLDKIFERLYRVDPSRNRNTGASGLGLSICKSIVKAHGGVISARHSELGGLAIDIELPVSIQGH
ncbi:ATP-binding protein [Colwelliaceae bacterium BS250]